VVAASWVKFHLDTSLPLLLQTLEDLRQWGYTSGKIKKLIKDHPQESRREWMLWLMERAGTKNSNNKDFQFWQQHNKPIELYDNQIMQQKLDYIHPDFVGTQ
jgi:hypothetical protein